MSTEIPITKKDAQSEVTRTKLVAAARDLFGARGCPDVGPEEIVRAAGVTRGALYHQFGDKRELFEAVLDDVESGVIGEVAGGVARVDASAEALRRGCIGWLEACSRPEIQRIFLLDAPAVL